MPELPDIQLYVEALHRRIVGSTLENVRLLSPFVLRSVDPPLPETFGRTVVAVRRMGKRIVMELEDECFLVIHLMIAGRLRWRWSGSKLPKKSGLAVFDFSSGVLLLSEVGSKKRASLHAVQGEVALEKSDRGGLEVLDCSLQDFKERLRSQNHTLKRALSDPTLFSGIGNAFSDEILHAARLSPFKLTQSMTAAEMEVLLQAARATLEEWLARLRTEFGSSFPDKVTAFREGMAVHGMYGRPCPVCGTPVQRVVYAENEANYCPVCQTEGRLLRDRALSRLLKSDWPRSLEELEEMQRSTSSSVTSERCSA